MNGAKEIATGDGDLATAGPAGPTEAGGSGQTARPGPSAPAGGVERPPLAGRISYLFGGALPAPYRAWVQADLTGPGWRRRQALRPALTMLPFAIVFALLPGPVGTRLMLVGFLLVAAAALGVALSSHFRDRRLVQHGFPPVEKINKEDTDDPGASPDPPAAAGPAARPAGEPAAPGYDPDDPDGINA
ncbi:DUF5313 family protein [Frankia sp. CNm7]|uniref:DUF5313 family protein n=1 Tax=Frankia nepalensis TaxID=1836974 RepID=A0A937RXK1_9ACTN|nr:DUF5313 family protein [Frankia nepalensis]MBL7501716.1 DUF5313 family protein [Frankia nepalensis]MBL7514242.1 DUF5313 family protein [Frankia nepalensis]MBL7521836.1 DUF5313 family protein [Frankia nepalensis]MBL7633641.1 DUF5313 family protein [Frankia nepalensis]